MNEKNIIFNLLVYQIKQMETTKMSFELQVKGEKDKSTKMEKEFEKLKIDKAKWETKAQAVEAELSVNSIYFQF